MRHRNPSSRRPRWTAWSIAGLMLFLAFMCHDAAMAGGAHSPGAWQRNSDHQHAAAHGQPLDRGDAVEEGREAAPYGSSEVVPAMACGAARAIAPALDSRVRFVPSPALRTDSLPSPAPPVRRWEATDRQGAVPNDCRAFLQVFLI